MNEEYLSFAKQLAQDAGGIILEYFDKAKGHYKEDNTIVTEADEKINQLVIDRVREKYPEHGIYGEEASFDEGNSKLWVCDPLDGTEMFSRGIPVATFSLAYVVDGEPVIGVIYDPFTKRLYSAIKGSGAFCNDEPIYVDSLDLTDKKSFSGFSYVPTMIYDISGVACRLMQKDIRLVKLGTIVGQAALVARGGLTASIAGGKRAWDVAATKVIIEEAGGKVTNLLGENQRYDREIQGVIISNGKVHDEIVAICKEVMK